MSRRKRCCGDGILQILAGTSELALTAVCMDRRIVITCMSNFQLCP